MSLRDRVCGLLWGAEQRLRHASEDLRFVRELLQRDLSSDLKRALENEAGLRAASERERESRKRMDALVQERELALRAQVDQALAEAQEARRAAAHLAGAPR